MRRDEFAIVVKATFGIRPDGPPVPVLDQHPITMGVEPYGEPNISSLRAESDLAPAKPDTDVYFLDPVAHAPSLLPAASWMVDVKVGPLRKAFRVTGPRTWV